MGHASQYFFHDVFCDHYANSAERVKVKISGVHFFVQIDWHTIYIPRKMQLWNMYFLSNHGLLI